MGVSDMTPASLVATVAPRKIIKNGLKMGVRLSE